MTELEFASILGMPYMGTGNDPTSANNRNIAARDLAGEKWEALNKLSIDSFGIQLYPHNHRRPTTSSRTARWCVTEDRVTGAPITPTTVRGESGKRLMEHYLDITDPDLCVIEMDIYWAHVAQHQHPLALRLGGDRVEDIFDPLARSPPDEALRAVPRQGRRPDRPTRPASATATTSSRSAIRQRHRLRDVLQGPGRQGFPQPELRAGQRPGGGSDQASRSALPT